MDKHSVRLGNGAMWSAVARLGLPFNGLPLSAAHRLGGPKPAGRCWAAIPLLGGTCVRPRF